MRAPPQEGSSLDDYQQAVDYLLSLQKFGIKFGLNRTENVLARLANPQNQYRCIHVAGTNGKGSTAAVLASILRRHGHRVGLYTSPHLVRFTERFQVDGKEVEPEKIFSAFEDIRRVLDPREPPTFFEAVTAMAFHYFAQEHVEWAVVETGMGGRLDATNTIRPEAAVITNVSFDHQEYLGRTLSAIAREKAGIIKPGVPVVTAARQPVVQSVIKATCLRNDSPLYRLGTHFRVRRNGNGSFGYYGLRFHWSHIKTPLKGDHQFVNAGLALAALEVIERSGALILNPVAVEEGLSQVRWPARMETLEERPLVILDGAHNPPGAECLRSALLHNFTYDKLHLVLGIMGDKDIRGIFRRLLPLAETAIFTKPRYGRAADPELLRRLARPYIQKMYAVPDPAAAIGQAKALAGPDDLICITGSLYFAGEVKEIYGEPQAFPGCVFG